MYTLFMILRNTSDPRLPKNYLLKGTVNIIWSCIPVTPDSQRATLFDEDIVVFLS